MTTLRPSSEQDPSRHAAIKTRIITHMNADHADSLSLFLQHYVHLPASQTTSPTLTDITLSQLAVTVPSVSHNISIPIDPPMESLSQARERMVSMHTASLSGLGLSELKVTSWSPPTQLWQWSLTLLATLCLLTFPFSSSATPGVNGPIYKIWSVGGYLPFLASLAYHLGPYALVFMVVAHVFEVWLMARGRLRRHRVPVGSGVWWRWVGNCFISGGAALVRFDEVVRDMEVQKGRKGENGGH